MVRGTGDLAIGLLGPLEVGVAGEPVAVPPGQQRRLLAALALEAGRTVSIGSLVECLWGEDLPADPRAGLQNNVQRLRRLLGAEAIRTVTDGYLLDLPSDAVDVRHFLVVTDRLTAAPGRRDLIDTALALWRGEPLLDIGSPALERDWRPALAERHLTVLEARADDDIANGRYSKAITDLRELTRRHRLRESLWARLLTALRRSGRIAEALEAYANLRTLLVDELGSDPAPDLQALYLELLDTTAPAEDSGPAGGGPAQTRAGRVRDVVPHQLPYRTPGFVGRGPELAALDALVTAAGPSGDPARVAVLHGTGGIGKTALALHWAYRVRDRFGDGELFIDLQGYGPGDPVAPSDALGILLRGVGVPPDTIPGTLEERAGLFRTVLADRRMLIVLDNAHDAEQVRPLLPGPDSLVLVTSRNRMHGLSTREGARGIALPELTDDEAVALLTTILRPPRDGAGEAGPAMAELVALCRGLPLALRIAADLRGSATDAVPRARALDALAGDDPTVDLRAVMGWSYDALDETSAGLFRLLGVHPGNITVPIVAVLLDTDIDTARATVRRLTAQHLLEPRETGRYRPHDLVREFAVERLHAEVPVAERDAAFRRLLDWYLHAANDARVPLGYGEPFDLTPSVSKPAQPPPDLPDNATAAQWYEDERATLLKLAAAAWQSHHDDHVWQLSRAMSLFLNRANYLDDRIEIGELGLEAAQRLADPTAVCWAAFTLGAGYGERGRYAEAVATLRIALDNAAADDTELTTMILSQLGMNSGRGGDYETAKSYHQRSVLTAKSTERPELEGHALLNFGFTAGCCEQYAEYVDLNDRALEIYRKLGMSLQAGLALINLSDAYNNLGRHDLAIEAGERALVDLSEHADPNGRIQALINLAEAYCATGRTPQAHDLLERALKLVRPEDPRLAEVQNLLDTVAERDD